jgi:hypothetical protein
LAHGFRHPATRHGGARAASIKATPFSAWDVQRQGMDELKKQGRLIEHKPSSAQDDEDPGF